MEHRAIIIGGGPAGWTAAIYAARAGLSPLVIAGYASGGQLMSTTVVDNFPGFPAGVQGPELMARMRQQAERFGATVLEEDAIAVQLGRPSGHLVTTDSGTWVAPAVIIATGATARRLDVPGEERYMGRGVATCAVCDGNHFRGLKVAVSGGGDAALEEVLQLSRVASEVHLLHRHDRFKASRAMQDRVAALENVVMRTFTRVVEVHGERRMTHLTLEDTRSGERYEERFDGLFVAIGHLPSTDLFAGQVPRDAAGYVQVAEGESRTAVPGVFVAGDAFDARYRQAITAAAAGCRAALEAERYLTLETAQDVVTVPD